LPVEGGAVEAVRVDADARQLRGQRRRADMVFELLTAFRDIGPIGIGADTARPV
jgi:hypothetical protein